MPREIVHLPHNEEYPQQAAAAFLAVVAYPDDKVKRAQFKLAAGSLVLRRRAAAEPEWASAPQMVTPGVLLLDPVKSRKRVIKGLREIATHRLLAAHIAKTLMADEAIRQFDPKALGALFSKALNKPIPNVTIKIKTPIKKFYAEKEKEKIELVEPTIRSLAQHPNIGMSLENVFGRVWGPSKCVLHLAVALSHVIEEKFADGDLIVEEILDGDWVPNAVRIAEFTRLDIVNSPRFQNIEECDTIQVASERLVNSVEGDSGAVS